VAAKKAPVKKVAAKKATAKKAAAKPVAAKKPVAKAPSPSTVAKKAPLQKVVPAKNEKKTAAPTPAVKKGAVAGPGKVLAVPTSLTPSGTGAAPESPSSRKSASVSDTEIKRITENLRKVGVNRPTKPAALRRLLKSLLAAETGDASIEVALGKLVAAGTVVINAESDVKYPLFESAAESGGSAP